jgi:hypothetical protein
MQRECHAATPAQVFDDSCSAVFAVTTPRECGRST